SREAEVAEVRPEGRRHRVAHRGDAGEVVDLILAEPEVLEVREHTIEAHGEEVAAAPREAPDEHLARRDGARHAAVEVPRGHGELVKVGPERVHVYVA